MKKVFEIHYSDITIRYLLRFNKTARYFSNHIQLSSGDVYDVFMNDDEFDFFRKLHPSNYSDDYVEYKGLIFLTCRKLMEYNYCIIHSVSFLWKGKAWLITGHSGIGKTTQYNNWINSYPDEIQMISGDMPIIEISGECIRVHPSPWNGKERIGNYLSAELGGIVILNQDSTNHISRSDTLYSVLTLLQQFAVFPRSEKEIFAMSDMVEKIVNRTPIWKFSNTGTKESTAMLRGTLMKYLEKENA